MRDKVRSKLKKRKADEDDDDGDDETKRKEQSEMRLGNNNHSLFIDPLFSLKFRQDCEKSMNCWDLKRRTNLWKD